MEVRNQAKDLKNQAGDLKRQANAAEASISFVKNQSEALTRQAKTMESQFEIIREESATMKRQADAMEGQSSLMLENIKYDRLVKRYERVNREMARLVGPLFARRKDPNIFSLKLRSRRIIVSPTSRVPDPNPDAEIYDFVSFWDSIDQNMYLNNSSKLQEAFMIYNAELVKYFELKRQPLKEAESTKQMLKFDKETKNDLIIAIENRYAEIIEELKDLEKELKIRMEKIEKK